MESTNPFGIYFNMMKIKYPVYDESLTNADFLVPTDKVNVFINMETVLNYISTAKDLEKKLVLDHNFIHDAKANFINIAAHYKDFFIGNGLKCNIFLYMTDLNSESDAFKETKYAEDFRSYYLTKYTSNPKFVLFGDYLRKQIIPDVKTICEFIPGVHFITSTNIDGGLIPFIIGTHMPGYKNLIISGDIHNTQYTYEENFIDHLYYRTYANNILGCHPKDFLKIITKEDTISEEQLQLFQNASFYRVLLACFGDKYRSIPAIKGVKYKVLLKLLSDGLKERKITEDIHNASLLAEIFPSELQESVYQNLSVIDVGHAYQLLSEGDIKQILSQITERSDVNALQKLNQTIFHNNQLRLESLLK